MNRATSKCPICKRSAIGDDPEFPFCSERCRFVDLGRWLGGEYRIGRQTGKHMEEKNA
jgi:endogenous inhibitor of DNA gyrase (YacG/DUF329 family)